MDEAESLVAAWLRHWEDHGFGYAVVEEVADHQVLGFAGAKHQRVVGRDVLNLYYRFAPEAWGRGAATESARAVVEALSPRFPHLPILARVAINNPSSIRVAGRLGLTRQDVTDPQDPVPHLLLASAPLVPAI